MLQIVLDEPGRFSCYQTDRPPRAQGQALVRVHRVGICGTDLHAFAGQQPFFNYPRILGHELGVEIVEIDPNEKGLAVGDRCAVEPYMNCGTCIACRRGKPNCCADIRVLGVHADGGMRSLLAVPVEKLHRSETLSLDQLALVETLGIGAHAVARAGVDAEETVLVIGAGPIGLGTVQFAQDAGARVVVMDLDEDRLRFCRESLGVEHTLSARQDNLCDRLIELGGGDLPTAVLDATGHPLSMAKAFDLVAHGGRIVFVGFFQGDLTFNDPNFHKRELTLMGSRNSMPQTFERIITAIEAGRIDTSPWITHRMSLEEVVDRFAPVTQEPSLLKAMIEIPG